MKPEEEIKSFEKTDVCIFFNMCEKCGKKYYHNKSYHYATDKLLCPDCSKSKTFENVCDLLMKLSAMQVYVTMKHTSYFPGIDPEYTSLPTKLSDEKIQVFFYLNDTYNTMYDRAERFLTHYNKFVSATATMDFISLLDDNKISKYFASKKKPQ